MMLSSVTRVERVKDFVLRIHFSDGTSGEHDFAQLVQETGSMVEPLREKSYFDRVFVDWGALTWPNGFDLDPINLQDTMKAAGELHRQAAE